jgi:hypothetical protein
LKSLTLLLTGPNPHLEYELSLKYPRNSSVTYDAPIGRDGLFREGSPTLVGINPGHIPTLKGTWLTGQTFEVDSEDLGQGRKTRIGSHVTARSSIFTSRQSTRGTCRSMAN